MIDSTGLSQHPPPLSELQSPPPPGTRYRFTGTPEEASPLPFPLHYRALIIEPAPEQKLAHQFHASSLPQRQTTQGASTDPDPPDPPHGLLTLLLFPTPSVTLHHTTGQPDPAPLVEYELPHSSTAR
jgi:hypothetical protein